jgi:hypothetical protein
MRHTTVASFLAIALSGAAIVGCGGGGGGSSGGGASTTAASTSSTPTPTGSATTTPTTSTATPGTGPVASGPDTSPPVVTLTSPQRGEHTTQTAIMVTGTAIDQSGVSYLVVNGAAVLVGANGAFAAAVPVTSGLNIIELRCGDALGHEARTVLPVIAGTFLPETSNVGDAVAVRLNRPAFDAIERLAATQLGGVNLAQMIMAQNPLFDGNYLLATVTVTAQSATFGAPTLDLTPQAGGLRVHVELPNIDVRVRAAGRLVSLVNYGVNVAVTADKATLDAVAVVTVTNGVVTTTLQNTTVTLDNFRFDIGGIPTFLENLARNAVRNLIQDQVKKQVETIVPREVNKAIAGATGPIVQTVLGRQVSLVLVPKLVLFDADGALVVTDGDLRVPPLAGATPPTSPGSLITAGNKPSHGVTPSFHASLNDDMLNRVGHAAWKSGLMNMKIDQTAAVGLGLPAWFPMDAFLLQIFFPQLAGHVNPADPLELELSTGAPATFRTLAAPGLLEAGLGDLTIAVYVAPAGRPRQLVLKVGVQAQLPVAPSLSANNVLKVDVSGRPTIKTDVFETPLVALNELAIENFVDFIAPPVLQLLPRAWSGFPLPLYPGVSPRNVQFTRDGPSNDWVTIKGDL